MTSRHLHLPNGAIREVIVDETDGSGFHIVKTQNVEGIMQAIHEIPGMTKSRRDTQTAMKLKGTIPIIIGLQWAKESGTTIYSKPWYEYCRKKLDSNEFNKFRVMR